MDSSAVNDILNSVIPDVPCNGCFDCCNGVLTGSQRCPNLVDGKCAIRDRRPLECRLYGTLEGKPCFRGKIAFEPLTPQQEVMVRKAHAEITGGKSRYEPI